jgi:predicted DNA-binding transcriptional regulator YafY
MVEELRAVAPRHRSARWLAERFEVSVRTVERDLSALQQAGVPIWAEPGRTGGYAIDAAATLGPLALTLDEALAVLVGLGALRRGPFGQSAGTAVRKLLAVMPGEDARRATTIGRRIHLLEAGTPDPVPPGFAAAIGAGRVVRLAYRDRDGAVTRREVEPLGSIGKEGTWYLVAWCRLREGVRAFRADRVISVELTDERPQPRALRSEDLGIRFGVLRSVVDDPR